MKSKRYPEEFKREAVKQVTERGYSVAEVAQRLDTTTHSWYAWIKKYEEPQLQPPEDLDLATENARLKSELRWITEERDILKRAARYFANNPE